MRASRDEGGAIQVVEAILVAILVASALLFFALTQRPTLPPAGESSDLQQTAQDIVVILQGDTPGSTAPATEDRLQTMVRGLLAGTITSQQARDNYVGPILPDGTQFFLQVDTGSALTQLTSSRITVPVVAGPGAQSATGYVLSADATPVLLRVDLVVWDVF